MLEHVGSNVVNFAAQDDPAVFERVVHGHLSSAEPGQGALLLWLNSSLRLTYPSLFSLHLKFLVQLRDRSCHVVRFFVRTVDLQVVWLFCRFYWFQLDS